MSLFLLVRQSRLAHVEADVISDCQDCQAQPLTSQIGYIWVRNLLLQHVYLLVLRNLIWKGFGCLACINTMLLFEARVSGFRSNRETSWSDVQSHGIVQRSLLHHQ